MRGQIKKKTLYDLPPTIIDTGCVTTLLADYNKLPPEFTDDPNGGFQWRIQFRFVSSGRWHHGMLSSVTDQNLRDRMSPHCCMIGLDAIRRYEFVVREKSDNEQDAGCFIEQ